MVTIWKTPLVRGYMSLRTKLILILTCIVIAAVLCSSTLVYLFAASELEQRAQRRLLDTAALLAESIQFRFDAELRKFEYWAANWVRNMYSAAWPIIMARTPRLASGKKTVG